MSIAEDLMRTIDAATAPDVMSKKEAAYLLEELMDQIAGRLEALRHEIATDEHR